MSDLDNEAEAPAEAVETPPEQSAPAEPDFDALMREYDKAVNPPAPPKANGSEAAPAPPEKVEAKESEASGTQELAELRQWAEGVEHERLLRRERDDINAVFQQADSYVEDFDHLPPDFVERWFAAEHALDAELREAWSNRYASDGAMRHCRNRVRHALERLRDAAKKVPDSKATETRNLIAGAVLAQGRGSPIPQTPPRFGKLTDAELRKHVSDKYGYEPKF